jgi:hypothetical protein
MALQPFCWILPLFHFPDLLHSRWDSLVGGSARRKAATCTHKAAHTQTFMSEVAFETTTSEFELAKIFHALNRAATVNGSVHFYTS